MAPANRPVYPPATVDKEMWHLLDDAMAGIHRSRRTIDRTASYLRIAQRCLVEGCAGAVASPSTYELRSLLGVLKRIGAHVADERVDLAMESAELARLRMELHTNCRPCTDSRGGDIPF